MTKDDRQFFEDIIIKANQSGKKETSGLFLEINKEISKMSTNQEKLEVILGEIRDHLEKLNSKVATNVLKIAEQDKNTAVLYNEFSRVLEKVNDSRINIKEEGQKHAEIGKELELLRNLNTLITKHDQELFGEDGLVKWKDRAWGIFKVVSILWIVTTFIIGLKLFN